MSQTPDIVEQLHYIATILEANAAKFAVPDHIPAKVRSVRGAADTIEALRSEVIDLQNTIIRLTRELGEARDAEVGWLIEHEAEPKWLTLKPGEAAYEVCWTKESNDALRFARRVDADDYASTFLEEGPIRITEHRWG